MQKIKKFKVYDKVQSLNEIYQQSGMRFALMSAPKDGNLQSCPWVKCRDYLHDAFRAFIHKNSCKIYGFSYNYETDPPIDTRRIRLLVKNESIELKDLALDVIHGVRLINHYENIAGIKLRTKKYEVNPGIWVINGPNFWFKSPVLTTMFTFLLRLGELRIKFKDTYDLELQLKKHADPEGNNDAKYLKDTWNKMSLIAQYYDEIFLNGKRYEKCIRQKKNDITVYDYHNYMGIVSLCKNNYKYAPSSVNFQKLVKKHLKIQEKELPEKIEPLVEKVKPKPKKLLRVVTQYSVPIYNNYDASSFEASIVSSAKEGRRQCFSFTQCREHMIASIRAGLSDNCDKKIAFAYRKGNTAKIDTTKTRLVVQVVGVNEGKGKLHKAWQELFFAKRVLNAYEHAYGLEKSTISTVKLKHPEDLSTAWLFTSSAEWMANPVMFSIYVLIIRAAKNAAATIGTIDAISPIKLGKYWEKFYNYIKDDSHQNVYIHKKHKSICNVINLRKDLFIKTPEQAFFADNGDQDIDFYKKVGITSLLDKKHMDKDLINKAKKLNILQ